MYTLVKVATIPELGSEFVDKMVQGVRETLWKISKCRSPSRNVQVGDVVHLREEPTAPTRWPLARSVEVHPGKDGKVRVATVETAKGRYKRAIVKMLPLVYHEDKM